MAETTYLIGVDIGTSSTKAVVTDQTGHILASSTKFYDIMTPHAAWAESWPSCWVDAAFETIRKSVKKSGIAPDKVQGICVSGLNGGSGIPLNEKMEPVRPCIIWMDRRANDIARRLNETLDINRFYEITENGIDSYYGFTKMLWIKENEPENWDKTKIFLQPNHYIVYKLTGAIVTDYTTAGNIGGIYDFEKATWSDETLNILGIPKNKLPEVMLNPTDIAGTLSPSAAETLGLIEGIPVAAGCVDCLASSLAAGAWQSGDNVIILSTSLNWGVLHTTKPHDRNNISMPYVVQPQKMRHTLSAVSTAGALTRWYTETFASDNIPAKTSGQIPFKLIEEAASHSVPGSHGLLTLPYFMGERSPIWDSQACGTMFGLTLQHTQGDIYRSILESIGYALRHIIENFDINTNKTSRLVGGGTNSQLWPQILSDITGLKMLCIRENTEAPFGDAFIAGIASGVISGFEKIASWSNMYTEITPNLVLYDQYSQYYQLYKRLYLHLKDDMHILHQLSAKDI